MLIINNVELKNSLEIYKFLYKIIQENKSIIDLKINNFEIFLKYLKLPHTNNCKNVLEFLNYALKNKENDKTKLSFEYIRKRGFELSFDIKLYEEYRYKIKNKLITKTSLDAKIYVYGKEKAEKLHKEFKKKNSNENVNNESREAKKQTKDNFIRRHGDIEGPELWNAYVEKRKFNGTKAGHIEKYGEQKGNDIFDKRQKALKNSNSIDHINLYGTEIDKENRKTRSDNLTYNLSKEGFIENHGEEKWRKRINKAKHYNTLDYFIEKEGLEKGLISYEEAKSKKTNNLENFICRYGNIEGPIKFKEYLNKCSNSNKGFNSSAESLIFFLPLANLLKNKFPEATIYLKELNDGKEYCIESKQYDFTFIHKNIKIIVEYHGRAYHCHPNSISEWKHPKKNITVEKSIEDSELRKKLAVDNGFDYLVIWGPEGKDNNNTQKYQEDNFYNVINIFNKNNIKISPVDIHLSIKENIKILSQTKSNMNDNKKSKKINRILKLTCNKLFV